MKWVYNDGGREAAGFKGKTRDCVTRSISIITGRPYREVYDALNELAVKIQGPKRKSNSRTGVSRKVYEAYLKEHGYVRTSTMFVGQGCKVHLCSAELPSGRLIVQVTKHLTAVVDGVVHDTNDPSRGGSRCVYGYYQKA